MVDFRNIRLSTILAALVLIPNLAFAQFTLPGIENSVTLTMSPSSPGPNQSVHATAESTVLDLTTANITWYVNGKVIAQGTGKASADFTTGALGAKTSLEVHVAASDGNTASVSTSIIPSEVDLFFDSDSYVPPFYRGRALPSSGTNVRLQTIARFRSGGAFLPDSSIIFTWLRNGQVLGNISGYGKSSVSIPAPELFDTDNISVEAHSADGQFSGTASTVVPSVDPFIALYEDNPLFGLMYHQELLPQTSVPEAEMTFAAMPYFADANSADDKNLQYKWSVNSRPVAASSTKLNELTVSAQNANAMAQIALEVTHATNFFMDAKGSWNVTFSHGGTGSGGSDPFHSAQ